MVDRMVQNIIMRMEMGNFLVQKPKGQRKIGKICAVGDVEELDMGRENVQYLDRAMISLSNQLI